MSEPRLVADPDGVDPGWLTEVLRHSGTLDREAEVAGFEAEAIGTGQVGCNVRYRLSYRPPGAGPPGLVVKFASRDEASRAAGVQTLTYETEVAFYREIAPTVEVARPFCHFAAVEPGTANVVLVLEDLAPAVQGDQLAGCSPEQAVLAAVEAARLHGPRWGDASLQGIGWLAAKQAGDASLMAAFAMFWPSFVERYGARLSPASLQVGAAMAASPRMWTDYDPSALTVCHADYRLDNMLFGPDRDRRVRPLTVVDWQTVRLGVGTSDLAYFMGAAMAPEARRACEAAVVDAYLGELDRYRVDYSAGQCWEDYRRHTFNGFFMAVFASMVVGRTERGDEMFMTMANGAAAHVLDLDALGFLPGS